MPDQYVGHLKTTWFKANHDSKHLYIHWPFLHGFVADESILVQVVVWWHQTTIHYRNQYWTNNLRGHVAPSDHNEFTNFVINLFYCTQIAKFTGPTRAHLGPAGPVWATCWPHEPCHQGIYLGRELLKLRSVISPIWTFIMLQIDIAATAWLRYDQPHTHT